MQGMMWPFSEDEYVKKCRETQEELRKTREKLEACQLQLTQAQNEIFCLERRLTTNQK
jgi:hypothetical protein